MVFPKRAGGAFQSSGGFHETMGNDLMRNMYTWGAHDRRCPGSAIISIKFRSASHPSEVTHPSSFLALFIALFASEGVILKLICFR